MPFLVFGLGSLLLGAGAKFFGDGVAESTRGISKLVLASGVVGVVYIVAKKQGVIK